MRIGFAPARERSAVATTAAVCLECGMAAPNPEITFCRRCGLAELSGDG